MRKKFILLCKILTGLCLLWAVVYRFALLNVSYEYDELFTAVTSDPSLSFSWIFTHWLLIDVHPPLHNAFLWVYNHFVPFGPEVWLRLPSVIFGFTGLLLAWFMFPRRYGRSARLLFVTLLSTNFYILFYSQHARPYAMMFLLSVPLTFLFLKISRAVWKNRPVKPMPWVCFGVLSLLLAWTHYFGALIYGVFSLLLFAQALYFRRRITWFLSVPAVVFFLFLPWLLPNLWQNLSLQRFDGNWWMNERSFGALMMGLRRFFFSPSVWAFWAVCIPLPFALWGRYQEWKKTGKMAYGRDILLLLSAMVLAFAVAGLLSFKLKLIMGRYFMGLLPSFYLFFLLLILPYLRKKVWAWVCCLLFLFLSVHSVYIAVKTFSLPGTLPARVSSDYYQKIANGRELFVIAMESFPPPTMEAMYGFYPNRVFNMNVPVTELWQLPQAEREEKLARRDQAVIWMPNCGPVKLKTLSEKWQRAVGVEKMVWGSCYLRFGEKGKQEPPKEWGKTRKMKMGIPRK